MAIPFSRSTRSMNHDRFQPGIIAILFICLVLVSWITWFFVGELSIYTSSMNYTIREDGMLLGKFPAASLPQIAPGQQAELILPAQNGKNTEPIQAEVMNVPANASEPVEIFLFSSEPGPTAQKGQLKILLGKTSPANLIWRSIQQ